MKVIAVDRVGRMSGQKHHHDFRIFIAQPGCDFKAALLIQLDIKEHKIRRHPFQDFFQLIAVFAFRGDDEIRLIAQRSGSGTPGIQIVINDNCSDVHDCTSPF